MSKINCLFDKFDFGKYQGKTIGEVLQYDPGYIVWCNENVELQLCEFDYSVLKEISAAFPDFPLDANFLEQWSDKIEYAELEDQWRADAFEEKFYSRYGKNFEEDDESHDPYSGTDWEAEEWDALTDGQYGPYPGGDIDYDVFGF